MRLQGRAIHIRPLAPEDVARWNVDLQGRDVEDLIAVDVEDLGVCLAAVVDPRPPAVVLWSDADGEGTTVPYPTAFATALVVVVNAITPKDA